MRIDPKEGNATGWGDGRADNMAGRQSGGQVLRVPGTCRKSGRAWSPSCHLSAKEMEIPRASWLPELAESDHFPSADKVQSEGGTDTSLWCAHIHSKCILFSELLVL